MEEISKSVTKNIGDTDKVFSKLKEIIFIFLFFNSVFGLFEKIKMI